jgi:hypothetical protein
MNRVGSRFYKADNDAKSQSATSTRKNALYMSQSKSIHVLHSLPGDPNLVQIRDLLENKTAINSPPVGSPDKIGKLSEV